MTYVVDWHNRVERLGNTLGIVETLLKDPNLVHSVQILFECV